MAERTHGLAQVAAVLTREASELARLHRGDGTEAALARAEQAAAALDHLSPEAGPAAHFESATRALGAAVAALARSRAARVGLRPVSHHQRCAACGKVSLANTNRSAVTFRHRHRKLCAGAAFERVSPRDTVSLLIQ